MFSTPIKGRAQCYASSHSDFYEHLLSHDTSLACHSESYITQTTNTKAKPVGHGFVFSMAVRTIGEWLKLVPFLLGEEQLILKGGGLAVF